MAGYLAVEPGPSGVLRLLCFHHAGAGALSFARWQKRLGDARSGGSDARSAATRGGIRAVPVRLAGRETRLREPRVTDAGQLLDELDAQLGSLCEEPYALYGHSLGALVAYSFAVRREKSGLRPPELLAVGACPAPHLGMPLLDGTELHDRDLYALLERSGGAASTSEDQHPGRTMMSILRDDLMLARSLRAAAGAALSTPLLAYAGSEDQVAPAGDVAEWARYTMHSFRLQIVPGGHFFVRDAVLPDLLAAELRERRPLTPLM